MVVPLFFNQSVFTMTKIPVREFKLGRTAAVIVSVAVPLLETVPVDSI